MTNEGLKLEPLFCFDGQPFVCDSGCIIEGPLSPCARCGKKRMNHTEMDAKDHEISELRAALMTYLTAGYKEARELASKQAKKALRLPPDWKTPKNPYET